MTEHVVIEKGDPWPDAVSDGLNLPCAYCHLIPTVDYKVEDKAWRMVVPDEARLGVVCLECYLDLGGLPSNIEFIQVISGGQTAVLTTDRVYHYGRT